MLRKINTALSILVMTHEKDGTLQMCSTSMLTSCDGQRAENGGRHGCSFCQPEEHQPKTVIS